MDRWQLLSTAGATAAALLAAAPAPAEPPPGDYTFSLRHAGRERSYIVHVPKDVLAGAWPVVINFHGGGSSAAGQQAYSRMDAGGPRGVSGRVSKWYALYHTTPSGAE